MFGFDFASSFNAKVSSIVLSEIRIDQGESEQAEFERLRDFFKLSPSLQATDVYRLFMEDPVVLEIAVISYEPHPRDFDAHAFVVAQFCLLWICVSSIELDKIQDFYERLEVMRRTKSSLVTALERGEHIPKHEKLKKASGECLHQNQKLSTANTPLLLLRLLVWI